MKVLLVIDSLASGGAQSQLVKIGLGLNRKGHDVSILTYAPADFFLDEIATAAITYRRISDEGYFGRIFRMRAFIRRGHFDVVISFLEVPSLICELAVVPLRRWKLIVGERSANPNMRKSFRHILYRLGHVLADFVVANSNENIRLFRSVNPFFSKSKCRVIFNIVDPKEYAPSDFYLPLEDGRLKLLVAARHQYLKNLLGLIEAVNVLSSIEKQKLIIEWYGQSVNPPYVDGSFLEAKSRIKEYDLESIFFFFPATKQLKTRMQQADVVGLFSLYEGLPNSICEGMCIGKPVCCSAICDLPEILSHNRNCLFDPTDFLSIARALRYFLSLNKDELLEEGRKNRAIATELFSETRIIGQYLQLMD